MTPGPVARVGLLAVQVVALVVLAAVVARAVYYPFWAAGASEAALRRSWGGPSPVGATLAHWLVGGAVAGICVGLIVVAGRARRR